MKNPIIESIWLRLLQALGRGSLPSASAKVAVPWIIGKFNPKSVVDVGCGNGSWLREFAQHGVYTIGFDRKESVSGIDEYHRADLTQPFEIPQCDLAMSLEAGEHLPQEACMEIIRGLCQAVPVVIFAGGIPLQGGIGHINERWQSDWASMFRRHGYCPYDDLRLFLWNKEVDCWYAQDSLIYCSPETANKFNLTPARILDFVHPGSWSRIGPMALMQRIRSMLSTPKTEERLKSPCAACP